MPAARRCIRLVCLVAVVAACAPADDGREAAPPSSSPSHLATIKDTVVGVCKDAFHALQTPLEDLNIKRQPIPEKLQACAANPYTSPPPPFCFNINKELLELNTLLGPDMEAAPLPWATPIQGSPDYLAQGLEQAPSFARQQAAGMVQSKTNIIPFRGVVRQLTGAEKHAKAVATAYEAGRLRRAFLKGLAKAYNCAPLAPLTAAQ